ncbi:MAG TPA: hypothetical protein DD001_10000 [Microcoleaceae bacterium UBA10368]|nr:hypothetical protein [Microcoleaceae cyanobacterium UBA10368]HCV32433.1 hypothetical protein [Microcoleaceae cyanobacterium UBA9251]
MLVSAIDRIILAKSYSGSRKSEVCPMPYALCPMPYMPYALCPMPYALCPMPYARQYPIFLRKAIIYTGWPQD